MKTKEVIVKELNELYTSNDYVVVVDFKGLNAEDTSSFRGALWKQCECRFLVVKNTLNKIASKGTDYEANVNFSGQCGVIFCNDLLKVSKVINEFCFKNNKLKFVTCLNKKEVCSEEQVKEFATLPSMDELRAKLLYTLNAAGTSLVRAMNEKVKQQNGDLES
jgi:large subunit ribosomal protein L10